MDDPFADIPISGKGQVGSAPTAPSDDIPIGPNGEPLNLPPNTGAMNTYGGIPATQTSEPKASESEDPFADIPMVGKASASPSATPNQKIQLEKDNPFADIPMAGEVPKELPWYKNLPLSTIAQTAAGAIQTVGGFERAGAAPVTDISGVNAPFQRGATTQEATTAFDKAIADKQAALDSIQGIVKKHGFSTAEYGNQINDLQREIGDLQAQKEQTLKMPQYASDTQQQELIQQRKQLGKEASALSEQAAGMFPALGVSQQDTSIAAQLGRGIGGVIDLAPAFALGPLGLPAMVAMGGSQAYGEGYDAKVQELKQQGITDQNQLDEAGHQAGSQAAINQVPALAAYTIGGALTTAATSALLKGASPLVKGLVGGTAAAGVNLGVSGGLRKAEGGNFLPNVEQAVPDILFGGIHGVGTGLEARAEAKKAANAELGGPAPEVAPSSVPGVNEKEAAIVANADALHEVPPSEVTGPTINIPAATPEELAKTGEVTTPVDNTQKIADLSIDLLEHKPGSREYDDIQKQIDALKQPAEAPVAEAQPETPNAVQEQTTGEVGVRNAPAVGEGVGRQNEAEVPATEGQAPKEEVGPITENTRNINRDYMGYPKGTQVEIISKSKDPLSRDVTIQFPDGKTESFPELWLKKPKATSTKSKETLPNLVKTRGRDVVNDLLNEWNEAELSPDGKYIMGVVDPRSSMKPERIPVREFLDWLQDKESTKIEAPVEVKPTTPTIEPPKEKSQLELWADNTIKEGKKRLNVGLDPEVLSAYAVKGAFKIARGVRDFTAWSKEMLSEFGEAIHPHLDDLWNRANQIHNEEQITKYGPKPPSERDVYAKRVEDQLSNVYGRKPTAEEVAKYVDKKFGKAEAPAPAPITGGGGEGEKISIRKKDQEDQQRRGILTSVVPAGEGTSIARITEIGDANLRAGADPFDALAKARQGDFNGLATAKAYVQGLAKKVSEALKKYGPNSPEYKDLAKQYQDYYEGLRDAGTVASDILRTFQGETDLSDAADIAREYTKITGEEPSLSQHDQIRKVADKVNKTVEESNQAQQQHRETMDVGLSDVEVKTPTSVDESRQQVADLSDASGKKQKKEIDRLNNELEQTKKDLEEAKQAKATGQDAASLKSYYEAKLKDLQGQLDKTPKYGKQVFEQARKIVDKLEKRAEEADKRLKKKLAQLGAFPDVTIVKDVAEIMAAHIARSGLEFAESSALVLEKYGPKIKPYLKDAWAMADKIAKGEGVDKTAFKKARQAKEKPVAKMTPEEKASESLRKRIAQAEKKINDLNSGKITTPKDVEKVTSDEIKRLEDEYNQKKKELSDARLKAKQRELFDKGKVGDKLNPEQIKTLWETAKKFYLDKGESDYDKMINDMASDLGLLPNQIREAFASPKGARKASDEMYLKQRDRQMALDEAKRWLDDQKATWIGKTFGAAAEAAFRLAIFGHGTAFIGTHAPTTIYTHPRAAFRAWLKGFSYSFTGKNGQIKNIIENKDLIYRPNWITARKAGLENDPREIRREGATKERGDSVMARALNTISGGRGFDALFHLRQDMFDQAWDKLSITQRTPEMAEMFANSINNATGFTKGGKGTAGILQSPITKIIFFAPKLIASRFKWLIQDPARMLGTFTKMVNPFTKVTPEERMSAIYEAKNKAKFLAYLGGTLLANQALLSITGSNQSINFTNPKKNDWLAYKGFGYQFSTVGAFTRIVRLVAQEYHAVFGDLNRFEKAQGGREQAMKNALYSYFRSGFSPIVRDMVVGATGKDYVGNVAPWSNEQPDRGRRRLTWGEIIQEQFAPIPISEASTQKEIIPSVAKAASAAFSGGRLETPADIADYEKSLLPKGRTKSGGFGSGSNTFGGFGEKGFGQ